MKTIKYRNQQVEVLVIANRINDAIKNKDIDTIRELSYYLPKSKGISQYLHKMLHIANMIIQEIPYSLEEYRWAYEDIWRNAQ